MSSPKALIARDPKTYRRQGFELSSAWHAELDPELIGHMLAAVVNTIARRWVERYSVTMPVHRIEWSIEEA